jgi:hypothetical protein
MSVIRGGRMNRDLELVERSQALVSRARQLLRRPIYPWESEDGVPVCAPHFTLFFAHAGQAMQAAAFQRPDFWELLIHDETGGIRCRWHPDAALFQEDAARIVPAVLAMMVAMVRDGVLPLDNPHRQSGP